MISIVNMLILSGFGQTDGPPVELIRKSFGKISLEYSRSWKATGRSGDLGEQVIVDTVTDGWLMVTFLDGREGDYEAASHELLISLLDRAGIPGKNIERLDTGEFYDLPGACYRVFDEKRKLDIRSQGRNVTYGVLVIMVVDASEGAMAEAFSHTVNSIRVRNKPLISKK